MTTISTATSSSVHAPRPVRELPPLPSASAQRELATRARKTLGMDERCSRSFAYLWADPADISAQVSRPRRMRIPGATLLFVEGEAWATSVIADVDNPRIGSVVEYPLAAEAAGRVSLYQRATSPVTSGPAELRISAASRQDLVAQLETAMNLTRANNDLNPPVSQQGIMDAPIAVMTRITFQDGASEIVLPVVREGTSRTSHAQRQLGLSAQELLFTYPASSTPLKRKLDELSELVSMPDSALSDEQRAQARCMVIPLIVIVGAVADSTASGLDLAGAVEIKIGQEHINTKRPWDDAARSGKLATSCIAAAARHGISQVDTDAKRAWLCGEITSSEAQRLGVSRLQPDDRFADLVFLFTTAQDRVRKAIREPIFLDLEKPERRGARIRRSTKVPLAVELMVRGLRGGVMTAEAADRMASVLTAGADTSIGSWVPSSKPVSELLREALAERAADAPERPATTELRVRSLYYLARYDAIRGPRNDVGPGGDRRSVAALLDDVAATERGLQLLARAIEDGRRNTSPTIVDETGQALPAGHGGDATVTHRWLRESGFPRGVGTPTADPLEGRLGTVNTAVLALDAAIADLSTLSLDDGTPVVEQDGVENLRAKAWMDKLDDIRQQVGQWRDRYIERRLMSTPDVTNEAELVPPVGA
ncbi:hypothetical protein [Kineococcus indalonis]|uniref:hypothetical protein n=1 Tax=Kineococcus indalonis TaxID=2696566 RepID=UPI001412FB04|nr:hypothetical protein [Kineococcus indalonis]NAZ85230.1 hypothetical protein [Kineococcus indalonis]